jgi:hypothetical protein
MMEAVRISETSVTFIMTTLLCFPEGYRLHVTLFLTHYRIATFISRTALYVRSTKCLVRDEASISGHVLQRAARSGPVFSVWCL